MNLYKEDHLERIKAHDKLNENSKSRVPSTCELVRENAGGGYMAVVAINKDTYFYHEIDGDMLEVKAINNSGEPEVFQVPLECNKSNILYLDFFEENAKPEFHNSNHK